jgi:hypothetical protein
MTRTALFSTLRRELRTAHYVLVERVERNLRLGLVGEKGSRPTSAERAIDVVKGSSVFSDTPRRSRWASRRIWNRPWMPRTPE